MKLSVPSFLQTLGAWHVGVQEGKQQRAFEQQQGQEAALLQTLRLLPQLQGQYADQQARELEPYDAQLRNPNLTPESYQQIFSARQQVAERQRTAPNPYGPEAYSRILGQSRFGKQFAPLLNPPATGGLAGPAVSMPTPQLRDPRKEAALGGIRNNTELYLKQAIDAGDAEAQNALSALQTALDQQQVTPEQAGQQLRQIVTGLQAKGSAKDTAARLKMAAADLDEIIEKDTAVDAGPVAALRGELATIDPSSPAGLKAAQEALSRYGELVRTLKRQPSQQARELEARRRQTETYQQDQNTARTHSQNNRYLDAIARAKTPEAKIRAVNQQRVFAATPEGKAAGVEPYGGDAFAAEAQQVPAIGEASFSPVGPRQVSTSGATFSSIGAAPSPQVVTEQYATTRGETAPEIQARQLKAAAEELPEGSDEQQKLLRGAFGQYFGLVKSETFSRLPDAQRRQVLDSVNDLAQQLKLPKLPVDLTAGLNAKDKAHLASQEANRKLQERRIKETERHNRETERQAGDRETRLAQAKATTEKLPEGQRMRAQALLTRMNQVHSALIKANSEVQEAIDAGEGGLVEQRGKRAREIAQQWEDLNKEFQEATKGVGPASTRTITPGETRTITFNYNGKTVTRQGTFEQFREAFGKTKGMKWLQETWASGK